MKRTIITLLACGLLFVVGGAYASAPRAHVHKASITIHVGCRPHWRRPHWRRHYRWRHWHRRYYR